MCCETAEMTLTPEQIESLKGNLLVCLPAPELGADVILIRAAEHESLEQVLEETLRDLREQRSVAEYAKRVVSPQNWAIAVGPP